jgi:hypothetical protein
VRHGRVLILATVVLTGVTGCANRPNNLETYYDNPGSGPTSAAPAPAASSSSAARNAPASSTTATDIAQEVTAAVLTSADLSGQGVHVASTRPANGACFNSVPAGDPRGTSWLYNSGSSLIQQVTGYLDKSATDVVNQAQCGGRELSLPSTPGADVARGWCQGTTCTVLLATGHVLSGLQVDASTESRAADAVQSVAPIAAAKLPES